MVDKRGWSRPKAVIICSSVIFAGSVLAALSLGAVDGLSSFEIFEGKAGVLSTLDHLAANWLLPLGGLGTTIFVGWFLGRKNTMEELGLKRGTVPFHIWLWCLRVIAPAAIIALLTAVIMGWDFA